MRLVKTSVYMLEVSQTWAFEERIETDGGTLCVIGNIQLFFDIPEYWHDSDFDEDMDFFDITINSNQRVNLDTIRMYMISNAKENAFNDVKKFSLEWVFYPWHKCSIEEMKSYLEKIRYLDGCCTDGDDESDECGEALGTVVSISYKARIM